jgi:predicted MFS family arabinose efflux permease
LEVSVNWRPIPLPDSSGIAHALSARPSTLQRNLLLDLSAAVGLGAGLAVVGSLLPSMARQQGLGSMGLAAFAAIPFLTSLLGLLAGRIGPRTPKHLSVYRALGAAGLLLVLVAPEPLFMALAMLGFWLAWSLGAPMQQRIWSGIYPSASRGRLLGIVGSGRSLATMTALLAFTFAAAGAGWLAIVAVVAVVGIVSGMAPSRLTLDTDEEVPSYGAVDSIRTVLRRPMLRRVTTAQLVFGSGMVALPALIAMVMVDRLGLTLGDIAIAGFTGSAVTVLTFGAWGRLASRTNGLVTMTSGTILGTLAMVTFALAPDFTVLLVASALIGAANAAIDVSWPLLIADHAARDEQAAAAAGLGAIMGLRGLIMPFVIVLPIQLGLLDVTGALLLCVVAGVTGTTLYLRLSGLYRVPVRVAGRAAGLAAAGLRGLSA